jgi:peptide/nickel transport system ATP-binding protein
MNNGATTESGLIAKDLYKNFKVGGSFWSSRPATSRVVLNNLTVTLRPGEAVGLIGRTGAGKTTLARVMGGLLRPDAGLVSLEGEDLYQGSPAQWRAQRSKLRYVFQNPDAALHPGMTAGTILKESLARAANGDAPPSSEGLKKLADDYLLHESWLHRLPAQLSLGQRRRLALARSLASQPRYALLDEPFSGLDSISKRLLWRVFHNIHTSGRIAILLVSHDVDSVCELCNRVLVMQNGNLVEELCQDDSATWQISHPYAQTLFAHSDTPFQTV